MRPHLFLFVFLLMAASWQLTVAYAGMTVSKSSTKTSAASLSSGLVGHWTFDGPDISGTTATDKSGSGNNGTISGATKTIGRIGQGLKFDGADDEVTMDGLTDLDFSQENAFTFAAWVYPTETTTRDVLFSRGATWSSPNSEVYFLGNHSTYGNAWYARISDGTNEIYVQGAQGSVVPFVWQHVVLVWDGSTLTLYKNTEVLDTGGGDSFDGIWNASSAAYRETSIGADGTGERYYWPGTVDDVRIYNRVLPVQEIKVLYNMGAGSHANKSSATSMTALSDGLVGHWTFDGPDISGTTATDKSGSGNNGTISGATQTMGRIGQGLCFNGTSDKVTVNKSATINNLYTETISFWMYPQTTQQSRPFSKLFTTVNLNGWSQTRGIAYTRSRDTGYILSSSDDGVYSVKQWSHVTVTYDGSSSSSGVHIYVNAVEVPSYPVTLEGAGSHSDDSSYNLFLGAESLYFAGILDDVRLYNRVLSSTEIQRLYNIGAGSHANKSSTTTTMTALSDGLVGHWTFDGADISGTTATDKSGQGNNGTLTNGPVAAPGRIGQGLKCDGVNDYVSAAGAFSDNLGPVTYAVWLYPRSIPNSNGSFIFCKGFTRYFRCYSDHLGFVVSFDGASNLYSTSASTFAFLNTWSHIALTWDGSTTAANVHMYVNGVETTYVTQTDGIGSQESDAANAQGIGMSSRPVDGTIDDVRIYNRALSAEEVKRLYNMGK